MLSIPTPLVNELKFDEATNAEAAWSPSLVPTPLVNRFAQNNAEFVTNLLREAASAGISPRQADVLAASKWRFGRRPVALLPIAERVMYRAVTERIREDLPAYERGHNKHSAFLKSPIEAQEHTWVVVTDLANFYSSIPVHRLAEELTVRTGRWQPVDWLRNFWSATSAHATGIPQVVEPSDWIAEAYADELHRRLLRRGLKAWRYVDDFRLAATSQGAAVAALEIFDEEVRSLGLSVNERKTYIQNRERYHRWRVNSELHFPRIFAEVREELREFDWYSGESVDAETAEIMQEAALRTLQLWRTERENGDGSQSAAAEVEIADLVGRAFQVLGAIDDPSGVIYCHEVLEKEPQLTAVTCRYLLELPHEHNESILDRVKYLISNVSLTKWQRLWVLELLSSDTLVPIFDRAVTDWTRSNLGDSAEYIRAQTLWTLGRNLSLRQSEWNDASLTMSRLGGPVAAGALKMTDGSDREKDRLLQSDKLDREVFEWVGTAGLMPDPF